MPEETPAPTTKLAYQFDLAGLFVGITEADESPMEPGEFLLPARCTFTPPPAPDDVPADKWPRFVGQSWILANRPAPPAEVEAPDPVEKLRLYLEENPDVAALLEPEPTS